MFYDIVRTIHIAAGAVALSTLGVPLASRKGGKVHVRSGRVYAYAMGISVVTGAYVAGVKIPDPATRDGGIFLLFVAVLAATTTVHGIRALRHKSRTGPVMGLPEVALPALLTVGGLAMAAWGLSRGVVLFAAFGALGAWIGGNALRWWSRAPGEPKEWLREHIGGMIGSGIGTVTAFLVVNAHRVDLPVPSWLVWLTPTFLGVPALMAWQRSVRPKRVTGAAAS
ncbi:MAG: hypothetical protein Q8P18_06870 [Pseudomonadota bacterium]|nr:hypothetical protein [Pseudomonadota bacterium]